MNTIDRSDLHYLTEQIKKHQITAEQTAQTVLDPLFEAVPAKEGHSKFVVIAYKAVERIVNYIEPMRMKLIADNCISGIEWALSQDITLDADNHPQECKYTQELCFVCDVTSEGDLLDKQWLDTDEMGRSRVDGKYYDVERMKLDDAIEKANNSYVFQALKVRLEVGEGLTLIATTWEEK